MLIVIIIFSLASVGVFIVSEANNFPSCSIHKHVCRVEFLFRHQSHFVAQFHVFNVDSSLGSSIHQLRLFQIVLNGIRFKGILVRRLVYFGETEG